MSSPSSSAPTVADSTRSLYPRNLPPEQRVLLCLPCYGAQLTQPFVAGLIDCLLATDIIDRVEFLNNDSLIPRGRNSLAKTFLASSYQWMMFIDVDLPFKTEHLVRLWLQAVKQNRRIVGGLYAMKQLAPHFVANWLPGEKPDENGAVKVREIGTGFLMIHREVFETMREKMPEIAFTADHKSTEGLGSTGWDFFAVGPYHDKVSNVTRYLSEDWMFCQRARDLGFDVWADTCIQIQHRGQMDFPADVPELVKAIKTVRAMGHPLLPAELL